MTERIKTTLFLLAGCLAAGAALGDVNMHIAKDQAKRAAGTSDAPAANQPSSSAPQQPTDPALAATLKNIADLRADFAAIGAAADVSAAADQKISLLNHLSAAAQGTKASSASVRKLADDLIAALAGKRKIAGDPKLAREIHALFNGAHVSAEQLETLLTDVKKILADAGVTTEAADQVADDLKAVAAETK